MFKQIIIARKDLNMSAGKLSAQVSHASMAFLTRMVRNNATRTIYVDDRNQLGDDYWVDFRIDKDIYEQWFNGAFTKVVLQAKNRNDLMKAAKLANDLGMVEGKDYFLIRDICKTELTPEEDGKTLTCIGFTPMSNEVIDKIGKKYHMYIG